MHLARHLGEQRVIASHPHIRAGTHLRAALLAIGERERAMEWLARGRAIDPDDILTQYNVACLYANLGNFDPAFSPLERLFPHANHETKCWVKVDSDLDGLRSLPRYRKVLESIQQAAWPPSRERDASGPRAGAWHRWNLSPFTQRLLSPNPVTALRGAGRPVRVESGRCTSSRRFARTAHRTP
jgi:hypothetical protein